MHPPLHLLPHVMTKALRQENSHWKVLLNTHSHFIIYKNVWWQHRLNAAGNIAICSFANVIPSAFVKWQYKCIATVSVFYRHTGETKGDVQAFFMSYFSSSLSLLDSCISEVTNFSTKCFDFQPTQKIKLHSFPFSFLSLFSFTYLLLSSSLPVLCSAVFFFCM